SFALLERVFRGDHMAGARDETDIALTKIGRGVLEPIRHRDQGDRGGSRGLVNFGEKRYIDNGWHGFPASSGPVRVGLRHSRVPAFPLISGSSGPSRELVGVTVEP